MVVLVELLDGKRRHEAASDKALLQTRGNPLCILHVALATRQLLDGKRIHQIKSEKREGWSILFYKNCCIIQKIYVSLQPQNIE